MKYGWEICDEVQQHVGSTADMAFVPAIDLHEAKAALVTQTHNMDIMNKEWGVMREALEKISKFATSGGSIARQALASLATDGEGEK